MASGETHQNTGLGGCFEEGEFKADFLDCNLEALSSLATEEVESQNKPFAIPEATAVNAQIFESGSAKKVENQAPEGIKNTVSVHDACYTEDDTFLIQLEQRENSDYETQSSDEDEIKVNEITQLTAVKCDKKWTCQENVDSEELKQQREDDKIASRLVEEYSKQLKTAEFPLYSARKLRAGEFLRFSTLTLTPRKVRRWELTRKRRLPSTAAYSNNPAPLILSQFQWSAVPDSEDKELLKNMENTYAKHPFLNFGHLKSAGICGTFRRSHRTTRAQVHHQTDTSSSVQDKDSAVNSRSGSHQNDQLSNEMSARVDFSDNGRHGRKRQRIPTPFKINAS